MKKLILATLILAGALCSCRNEKPGEAHLRINISNIRASGVALTADGDLKFVGDSYKQPLEPDSQGNAELVVPLSAPGYFFLSRNPVYLSPGDDMTIELHEDNNKTTFEGKGQQANMYLRRRFYSKGGSFLDAGRNLRPTVEGMVMMLDSMAADRRAELEALQGVTREFKDMERMRIKADWVNSLVYYPNYNDSFYERDISREEYQRVTNEYYAGLHDRIQPLLNEMTSDDKYLNIEVVRLCLYRFTHIEGYQVRQSPRFRELISAADMSERIRGSINREKYDELATFGRSLTIPDIRELYMAKLEKTAKFASGMPAVDVAVTDIDGKPSRLSDMKGKAMYIDVWATWCGPCLAEAPHFKALSTEFPGITFVSLSVDDTRSKWENHLKGGSHGEAVELHAEPAMRTNWGIAGIPRFILIDEEFNIISADAPRPSQRNVIVPLLEKYSSK